MKKFLNISLAIAGFTFGLGVNAHEGHDHDAPKNIQAPKGGVIKAMEETMVEVVTKGKDLKIYLYDKDLKPQEVAAFKVRAQAELPRGKKTENVVLSAKGTFYEATYDAKGSHRYTLVLFVTDPKENHEDKLSFTIEPKR